MEYRDDRIYGFGFRAHLGVAGSTEVRYVVFVYELPVGNARSEIVANNLTQLEAAMHVRQLTSAEMERRERLTACQDEEQPRDRIQDDPR